MTRNTFQADNIVSRNTFLGDNTVSALASQTNVTTRFPAVPENALLNEDGVTPIMNEDNVQEILTE